MVVSVIQSQISATELTVRPGYSEARLGVEVVNNSDRQASFHVMLSATGEAEQRQRRWYRITPMISSKVPVGTHSTYTVEMFDTPLAGFIGLANVTVRIISPELQIEERHVVRLRIEPGIDTVPFKLEVLTQTVQDYPGEMVEIPCRIHNTSRYPLSLMLSCPALASWLTDNSPTHLNLRPNRWHEVTLMGQIPAEVSQSHSRTYPFQVMAVDENGNTATDSGNLNVLPLGHFELSVEQTALTIPTPLKRWPDWQNHSTQTQIYVHNHSNLTDTLRVQASWPHERTNEAHSNNFIAHTTNANTANVNTANVNTANANTANANGTNGNSTSVTEQRKPFFRRRPSPDEMSMQGQVTLTPEAVQLAPAQMQAIETTIQVKRPWIGWIKRLRINVHASADQGNLDLQHDTETLQVTVIPIIPRWLQLLALLLLGGAIATLWYLQTYGQHHRQLVSTVQFNGTGTHLMSGSSDQTIRRWRVKQGRLRPGGRTIRLDKAVRVLQYRPVDNNQVAVGLENGEIQLWDLLKRPDQPLRTLINQTGQTPNLDDRVMALATTADARHLFSGYGSGLVSQWYIGQDRRSQGVPEQPLRERFIPEIAIYDVALVGPNQEGLAIAGRYNKLLLWPWTETERTHEGAAAKEFSINYPPGGQDDYITSLDTAEQTPFRLATADNQGRLMMWDLETCLIEFDNCRLIDQWQLNPDSDNRNVAIRDVALSADGCNLASVSDDGQMMLWPLTRQGRRQTKHLDGIRIKQTNTGLNTVDVKRLDDQLMIVSGADDSRIFLHNQQGFPLCQ